MIAGLIRWSARNVFLVGLATLFLTLAGLYAVSRVPLDAIPVAISQLLSVTTLTVAGKSSDRPSG